jgi:hypothetical protein
MSDYIIAIPSYKRAEICRDKTLAMLKKMRVPAHKIYVYLANREELTEYEKILDPKTYHKLIVGLKGIGPQRQFIRESWPEGKCIVSMDDDIASVDLTMSARFKKGSLDAFLKTAFKECKKHGSYIWGIYPVFNPFFRKARDEMTTCLNFIVGAFYGFINRPKLHAIDVVITKETGQKDDVEMTIKYFIHDGIVLRFNRIGFVTKYYGTSGGLGTFDQRLKPMKESAENLKKAFPEHGEISVRKNGMYEFRLKRIPATTTLATTRRLAKTDKKNKTRKQK